LIRAQAIHPKAAMSALNLACYASVAGPMEEAKERLRHSIELDKDIRELALDDEDLRPLWIGLLTCTSHSGDGDNWPGIVLVKVYTQ
jgi:hypothetical protein